MTPPQKDARTVANQAEARKYSTLTERAEVGRAARANLPRSRHGEWAPPPGRTDPLAFLSHKNDVGSRAPPDPSRTNGGVSLCVLSGSGRGHGIRLGV